MASLNDVERPNSRGSLTDGFALIDPAIMAEDDIITNKKPVEETQSKPPPRKRRRVVISCTECHRRKQKCDRKLPCTNCTQRGKESSCRYETGLPVANARKASARAGPGVGTSSDALDPIPIKAADFGYFHNSPSTSTLGFLKKIEGTREPLANVAAEAQESDHFGTRERYKILIRHLPARTFVEKLVAVYFHDFNWQYFGVDEDVFREHLEQWFSLPFNLLSTTGPHGIEPTLRSFPALVFQVLATALLAIPNEDDETYSSLKYAGKMTFEDLALDYSETGVALLSLLGKRYMSLTSVLAGWTRAAFLKYTGQVTEAWHQVGTAIRDAQEIGLHKDTFDPQPDPSDSTEIALEKIWHAQSRRRIWMTLVGWDLHTGAVLGRPTSVDFRNLSRTSPIDTPLPQDRRKAPVFPRNENDPPTPLTRAIWSFEVMKSLRDILDLEKEGPFPKDFSKVEKIHQELLAQKERTPPPFRLKNPDTRFDHLPECWWLPILRANLPQLTAFNFMALHRPYIFTQPNSRKEALKASLDMLEAQRVHFNVLTEQHYKTFSLFFGTFDAIVMMASIYILFPKEHPELLDSALQHFQWAVERFETMATRNRLAHDALGVLNAVWIRLKKAVGRGFLDKNCPGTFVCDQVSPKPTNGGSSDENPNGSVTDASHTPVSEKSSSNRPSMNSGSASSIFPSPDTETSLKLNGNLGPAANPAVTAGDYPSDMFPQSSDWPFPTDFDFSSLPPMYPMGDVAYNDLTGIRDDGFTSSATNAWSSLSVGTEPETAATGTGVVDGNQTWQFEGDFGNDTIWSLLNQFPPY